MSPELVAILVNTVLPALGAFIVGHLHLILPAKPASPATIRPFGQGGAIDILSLLVANILAGPAAPDAKVKAVTALAEVNTVIGGK